MDKRISLPTDSKKRLVSCIFQAEALKNQVKRRRPIGLSKTMRQIRYQGLLDLHNNHGNLDYVKTRKTALMSGREKSAGDATQPGQRTSHFFRQVLVM